MWIAPTCRLLLALPEFRQLFNLSDADRGLLNSAFFWTYALLQIPVGWLVDRYGTKFLMQSVLSSGASS